MFRPLYWPSLVCTLSYYKSNYTIYNVFVFVDEISFTSIKFAFKIITVAVEFKSYSNIKVISSIKSYIAGKMVLIHSFLSSTLDDGVVSHTPQPIYPQTKGPTVPTEQEAGACTSQCRSEHIGGQQNRLPLPGF